MSFTASCPHEPCSGLHLSQPLLSPRYPIPFQPLPPSFLAAPFSCLPPPFWPLCIILFCFLLFTSSRFPSVLLPDPVVPLLCPCRAPQHSPPHRCPFDVTLSLSWFLRLSLSFSLISLLINPPAACCTLIDPPVDDPSVTISLTLQSPTC